MLEFKLDYVSGQANVRSPVGYWRAVLAGTRPGAGEGAAKPAAPPAPTPETLAVIARQQAAAAGQQAAEDERFAAP